MSTPTHFDSEIISQTGGVQSSRVPTPLPDDPYVTVRTTPPPSDHTPTSPDPTPVSPLTNEEFEASKPSDTRITSSHSTASSDSTTPLSPNHPLDQISPAPTRVLYYRSTARMVMRTQPTLSPGMSARIAEAATLSPSLFRKRYISSYEMPSPSSSLTLSIWKRYWGTSKLDEGPGSKEEEEEAASEGQQQAVPVVDITADDPLGPGYRALRHHESMSAQQRVEDTPTPRLWVCATWVDPVDGLVYADIPIDVPPVCVHVQTPPSSEWSFGSLPVSPSSLAVPTMVASPVTTLAANIAVGEDEFLEVGAQLELHESILHDHTQRLDALPPAFFKGYDRDLRELYTRSREVRDQIFSQRYRLKILEQEEERATLTFGVIWRPVLALESWARHNTTMQRELQEMRDHVTILEREGSRRGQWAICNWLGLLDITKLSSFD
ncbi:hypothetical protein Tco_1020613 [Tanacetum coccineum]